MSIWDGHIHKPTLSEVWARAKQLAAGAAEMTIANSSEHKGNYRPAVVDAIPATVGMVSSLVTGKAQPYDQNTTLGSWVNNSMRRAALASQRTNETLGISNPKDTGETALRIIGGFATPAPELGAVKEIPVIAKAVRAFEAAPKVVKAPLKVAAEVAMPFRQTSIAHTAPIAGGLTVLSDVLSDQTVDPSTGTRYKSSIKQALGTHAGTHLSTDPEVASLDGEMLNAAIESGNAPSEEEHLDHIMRAPATPADEAGHDQEQKLGNYEKAALLVGTALGGFALTKYADNFIRSRQAVATAAEDVPAFTGKKYRSSNTSLGTKLKTKTVQADEPLRSGMRKYLGREEAEDWGYNADTVTHVAVGSKIRNFFATGKPPKAPMTTERLGPLGEAYAKELSTEEQRQVSDALLAASSLDDYKATGTQSSLNYDKAGNPVTPAQLEMMVQSVKSDPKLSKYYDAVQKSYDDLLKFQVHRGRGTWEQYNKLRERRPNYVPMHQNLESDAPLSLGTRRYSANEDQGMGMERALEEGGGVQGATGVGNPFDNLFDSWAHEIHRSEMNDLRANWLTAMETTGATGPEGLKYIEAADPMTKNPDIHTVWVNGEKKSFIVRNPEWSKALHMQPRAAWKGLENWRQLKQNVTTGPLASVFNGFAIAASPIYDVEVAMLQRPKGVKLGALNRSVLGAYAGAARHFKDQMIFNMASTLRDNLIRDNSALKDILGEQKLGALTTHFENMAENSILSEMDQLGITSHTMHGSPDPSKLISGLEDVAPHFKASAERALQDDIANAALNGDIGKVKAALLTGKSKFAEIRANRLAALYQQFTESFHNGVRYNAFAANRKNAENMQKLASQMRRLSGDASQHGSSDALNVALGATMYGNLSLQTLFEVGNRMKQQPLTAAGNWMSNLTTIAALGYGARLYDDYAKEKHDSKSPIEKLTSVTTFGGAEVYLDPINRFAWSFIEPILDHVSGFKDGKPDPNFSQVVQNWLHPDMDLDENEIKAIKYGAWETAQQNNPLEPASVPAISAAEAYAGMDPGMSRMTGEVSPIREQQQTGLETDVQRPNALMSGWWENMLSDTFSTVGRSMIQMSDDAYRAYHKSDGDIGKSMNVAFQRYNDNMAKRAGVFRPMLYGQYENMKSATDTNYLLLKERQTGIEQAVNVYNKDYRAAGLTGVSNKSAGVLPQEQGEEPPNLDGTQAVYIGAMANQLQSMWLSKNQQVLSRAQKEIEAYRNFTLATKDPNYKGSREKDINHNVNELEKEVKYQRMLMLTHTREYEKLISDRIGRPFRFDQFDPKDYLVPMPQPQVQEEGVPQ